MKIKSLCLLVGGVVQVLLVALHVFIAFGLQRQHAPAGLAPDMWANLKASLHVFNAAVTTTVLLFGYVSLFKRAELLSTSLGRAVSAFIALFYLQRVGVEIVVRGFSPVMGPPLLAVAALYAFAAIPPRANSSEPPV